MEKSNKKLRKAIDKAITKITREDSHDVIPVLYGPPPVFFVSEDAKDVIRKTVLPNIFWQKLLIDLVNEYPDTASFIIENLKDQ